MELWNRTKRRICSWLDYCTRTVILALAGLVIGLLVGVFETLFGLGLTWIAGLREGIEAWLLLLLPFAGLLIVWMFETFGQLSKKGLGLVFEISQGKPQKIPKRTVTLVLLSTWFSHIAGASVGKEGVAMQIGATISSVISRNIPRLKNYRTVFLVTGMASGFAGLFGTPFTAVFFAIEVLFTGMIELKALAPAICGAFSASYVASLLGLQTSMLELSVPIPDHLSSILFPLLIMGVLFGMSGGFFAWSLRHLKHILSIHVANPYIRIACGSIGLGLLLWMLHDCRYCGSGANLILAANTGGTIYPWDFLVKMALTELSLSIGFIGGEVTPLFAIGSSLGAVLAPFFGLSPALCAALGYAAVFGAGTNTWLAPMMIGMEMFGYQYFPLFFIVCAMASMVNGNLSIYSLQKSVPMPD